MVNKKCNSIIAVEIIYQKISRHAEGSKAFARYREVDEELQRSMVDFLE